MSYYNFGVIKKKKLEKLIKEFVAKNKFESYSIDIPFIDIYKKEEVVIQIPIFGDEYEKYILIEFSENEIYLARFRLLGDDRYKKKLRELYLILLYNLDIVFTDYETAEEIIENICK